MLRLNLGKIFLRQWRIWLIVFVFIINPMSTMGETGKGDFCRDQMMSVQSWAPNTKRSLKIFEHLEETTIHVDIYYFYHLEGIREYWGTIAKIDSEEIYRTCANDDENPEKVEFIISVNMDGDRRIFGPIKDTRDYGISYEIQILDSELEVTFRLLLAGNPESIKKKIRIPREVNKDGGSPKKPRSNQ